MILWLSFRSISATTDFSNYVASKRSSNGARSCCFPSPTQTRTFRWGIRLFSSEFSRESLASLHLKACSVKYTLCYLPENLSPATFSRQRHLRALPTCWLRQRQAPQGVGRVRLCSPPSIVRLRDSGLSAPMRLDTSREDAFVVYLRT